MRSKIVLAILAATLAGPALAATTAGDRMNALLVGVAPGEYTPAELERLSQAYQENDVQMIHFILAHLDRRTTGDDAGTVTPAKAQMAATLGINPSGYSTRQIAQMLTANKS